MANLAKELDDVYVHRMTLKGETFNVVFSPRPLDDAELCLASEAAALYALNSFNGSENFLSGPSTTNAPTTILFSIHDRDIIYNFGSHTHSVVLDKTTLHEQPKIKQYIYLRSETIASVAFSGT